MKYRISFTSDPWELTAYSDADWAGDINTLRLTIGFVVFLGKNTISHGDLRNKVMYQEVQQRLSIEFL